MFVESNPLNDYALPFVALTRGRKVTKLLRKHFGDHEIEDLWRPCFIVSSNLTTGASELHRRGPLWWALRASVAIPGLLPPLMRGGEVLVDGAVMNNLPADVMCAMGRGPVIGVDVTRYQTLRGGDGNLSGTLWRRVLLGDGGQTPGIVSLLLRAATVGSDAETRLSRDHTDLLFEPPLPNVAIRDWKAFDRAVEAGCWEHCAWSKDAVARNIERLTLNAKACDRIVAHSPMRALNIALPRVSTSITKLIGGNVAGLPGIQCSIHKADGRALLLGEKSFTCWESADAYRRCRYFLSCRASGPGDGQRHLQGSQASDAAGSATWASCRNGTGISAAGGNSSQRHADREVRCRRVGFRSTGRVLFVQFSSPGQISSQSSRRAPRSAGRHRGGLPRTGSVALMRRLSLGGVPLHPALVHFPVVFWVMAPLLDLGYLLGLGNSYWRLGWWAALTGVIAAFDGVHRGPHELRLLRIVRGTQHARDGKHRP